VGIGQDDKRVSKQRVSKQRERHTWLEDLGYVLTADEMRRRRSDYESDVFAGSKPLAWAWLAFIAALGGALGGTLASGALWGSLVQVALWLAVTVVACFLTRRATLAVSGKALAFLVAWNVFWSMLIGVVAMWGAQRAGAGWAYGIAGGMGFLVGICQGNYEPDDLEGRGVLFMTTTVSAPLAACAGAWLHRNLIGEPPSLAAAAITGAVAGTIFLAPVMAVLLARTNNVNGLKRVAALFLHRDESVADAVRLLDSALRLAPRDASVLARRAIAHTLAGHSDAAELDWVRHRELSPKSLALDLARGWVHLRRGRYADAAASFEAALALSKRNPSGLVGLGLARLRSGDAAAAVEALNRVPGREHDALSLTHLAEAHLAAGDPKGAARVASEAIDEFDSVFARSWLVRAEARRALGDLDGAAYDFSKAWHSAEEEGIQDRALAGLDAIQRPLGEEEEEEPEE
jgi:tetratricopeptide (TPR) repeat protein